VRAIFAVFFGVCIVAAFAGQALGVSISVGDSLKLYNGPGGEDQQGNSNNSGNGNYKLKGGELYVDLTPDTDPGSYDFVTFSLDFKEFDPTSKFRIDDIYMVAKAPGNSGTQDAFLDKKTAFLYNQFVTKKLTNYSHSAQDANDLQYTIWYIQGKIDEKDWIPYSSVHDNAKTWYKLAEDNTANSSSFYDVQVLNLNSINGKGNNTSKVDLNVLYASPISQPNPAAPVPEPSTLLLVAAGFASIGFYRRRNR